MKTCTPEEGYLLEEQGREIATLGKRLANAELLIEKLKEDVGHWEEDFAMFDRAQNNGLEYWRREHPDAEFMPDTNALMVWLMDRVERAEAVKDSLTSALKEICFHTAHWKTVENGMGRAFAWVWQTASTALRTADESSVVGLIDGTHAKQQEDSANADGDGDSVIDEEVEE